ncbi:MAG: HlyD family efflux transporter periplasmic adaptor subunit [Microbacteriaceae bacterium]|nr:HlyD family efflux transporter periplasmic adaptor subunit [Microbacteriaceae bacterium]
MSTSDAPPADPHAGGRFRSAAVASATTADELTRMSKHIPARRWLLLIALLVLLGVTILWACLGSVPVTKSGPGYALPEGGLRQVEATAEGRVVAFDLGPGDHVVAGEIVGETLGSTGERVAITAPETGTVKEIDTVVGAYVVAGERLAVIEPAGWPLVVYAYLPSSEVASLEAGTEVHVQFGAELGEEFGFVVGRVQSISAFPATAERLAFILQDQQTVETITALGPSNEVVVELERSARTPSGLVWGGGEGPAGAIPAGTPATAVFITGEKHPIEDVL